MKKREIDASFDILILDDVYSQKEVQEIWQELDNFLEKDIFLGPDQSGSARYEDGSPKKKNKAVFVDEIYSANYRNISPILQHTESKLLSKDVKNMMKNINECHGILHSANQHATLVSYYEESDMYDFHDDNAAYSTLSYFFREPKRFSGGEIVFNVNDEVLEIPVKNNMSIVFPSSYQHKVNEIKMEDHYLNKGFGRFCISQFIGISLF